MIDRTSRRQICRTCFSPRVFTFPGGLERAHYAPIPDPLPPVSLSELSTAWKGKVNDDGPRNNLSV